MPAPAKRSYWHRTSVLTLGLLTVWLLVTAGVSLWAPDMDFRFFGWPFGFWAASQGALVVYCLIVWVYAAAMDRLEAEVTSEID